MSKSGDIGIRLSSIDYEDKLTGIDYLTGFEIPVNDLIHVSPLEDGFTEAEAGYIARFCHKSQYGVGETKKPPILVTESSLRTIEKAKNAGITPEIRTHD